MNQLTVIDSPRNVDMFRASTDAAGLCKEIVTRTAAKIGGKRYVTVEGWQSIAIAHGCTASADNVERVTDEGASGFKCTGIIRRMSDGQEIARAEGFLGDDEGTWSKRPVYARRAMVQTRAISRACRSAFAHVVVMMAQGLETTPAEEMGHEGDENVSIDPETGEVTTPRDLNHPDREPEGREKLEGPHSCKTALRTAVHDIIAKVRAAETVEALNALLKDRAVKTTIAQAEFYWPSLINGRSDLDEDTGLKGAVAEKRGELSEDGAVNIMIATLKDCQTKPAVAEWLKLNGDAVEALDGAESRRFQLAYDLHMSGIEAMDQVHN